MSQLNTVAEPETKRLDVKKEIWEWVKAILMALIAFFIIRTFIFTMIRVDGRSMVDTLHHEDRLAVTIFDMKIWGPNRGDIVICTYPGEDHLCVKRVIGMPGETLEIKSGVTYINGEPLDESAYVAHPLGDDYAPITIPEGSYFVMGDNRANSKDSRDPSVGPLEKAAIGGKAHMMVWPFDRFHVIN